MTPLFGPFDAGTAGTAAVAARLLAALGLGLVVAAAHRRLSRSSPSSFSTTLVMLSVLIAMVTQVIGDNVARAFSLVGALSIVRFRTVVRDTQDTAYVIFAVAVGMACGAANLGLALLGLGVTVAAALLTRTRADTRAYVLDVRLSLGTQPDVAFGTELTERCETVEPLGAQTARQGAATEVSYRILMRRGHTPHALVTGINRREGIQAVVVRPEAQQS